MMPSIKGTDSMPRMLCPNDSTVYTEHPSARIMQAPGKETPKELKNHPPVPDVAYASASDHERACATVSGPQPGVKSASGCPRVGDSA